jgi:hypothetical protein
MPLQIALEIIIMSLFARKVGPIDKKAADKMYLTEMTVDIKTWLCC